MALLSTPRIYLAVLKIVQEKPISRGNLAKRLLIHPSNPDLIKTVDYLIHHKWLDEKDEKLVIGPEADFDSIKPEIEEMGPFGSDLVRLFRRKIKEEGVILDSPIAFQDFGVNPTDTFLSRNYCEEWRLIKFLLLKNALNNLEKEFDPILKDSSVKLILKLWKSVYGGPESYLYSTIKRGLLNELRNTVFLYSEDLGGLMLSVRSVIHGNPNKFIKRFLDYDPRKVSKFYRKDVPQFLEGKKDNEIRALLCYPKPGDPDLQDIVSKKAKTQLLNAVKNSVDIFKKTISDISRFYKEHRDAFLQYKHGNKNFIKPPNKISPDTLEKLKEGEGSNIIAHPIKHSDTALSDVDLPDDRVVVEYKKIKMEGLEEITRKIHWLMVLIINNLLRCYYPNIPTEIGPGKKQSRPMMFLKEDGWKENVDKSYSYRRLTMHNPKDTK